MANGEHYLPVDHVIIMNCDVPEAHGLSHGLTSSWRDGAKFLQCREYITHGCGRHFVRFTDDMAADINTQLHCSCEVQDQNILNIRVLNQLTNIGGCFFFHALYSAPQGLKFLRKDHLIHAACLSLNILCCSGTKSAVLIRCLVNSLA